MKVGQFHADVFCGQTLNRNEKKWKRKFISASMLLKGRLWQEGQKQDWWEEHYKTGQFIWSFYKIV